MRPFFLSAGILSVLSGLLGVAGYIIYLVGVRSLLLAMPVSPMEIVDLYSRRLVQASVFINTSSILFLFPAIAGMGIILREKSGALALHGSIFGGLGFLFLLIQNTVEAGLISVVTGHEPCATGVSREAFSVFLQNMSGFFMFPALVLTGVFYLLFGIGFRKLSGLGRWVGRVFLMEVALFVLTLVFFLAEKELPASLGILAQVLTTGTAYILGGALMLGQPLNVRRPEVESG